LEHLFQASVAEAASGVLAARFADDQIAGVARDPVSIRRLLNADNRNAFILCLNDFNRPCERFPAIRALAETGFFSVLVLHN